MRDAAQEVLAMSNNPSNAPLFKAIADAIQVTADKIGTMTGEAGAPMKNNAPDAPADMGSDAALVQFSNEQDPPKL